jgi:hypothetical protein
MTRAAHDTALNIALVLTERMASSLSDGELRPFNEMVCQVGKTAIEQHGIARGTGRKSASLGCGEKVRGSPKAAPAERLVGRAGSGSAAW